MKRLILVLVPVLSLLLLLVAGPIPATAQEAHPEADAEALLEYILDENPYTEWSAWPGEELEGYLDSGAPHGGVVRIFVNDIALSVADRFPGEMPARSIIVKENFTGDAPAEPGDLDALTVMYKVPEFNPEAGDWYWLKSSPDGSTVDAAGAADGCISCHGGVEGHRDYILRYGFEGEPALASAEQLQADEDEAASDAAEEAEEAVESEEVAESEEASPEMLPETGADAASNNVSTIFYFLLGASLLVAFALLFRRRNPA